MREALRQPKTTLGMVFCKAGPTDGCTQVKLSCKFRVMLGTRSTLPFTSNAFAIRSNCILGGRRARGHLQTSRPAMPRGPHARPA